MIKINTEYLAKCIVTLEKSYNLLLQSEPDSIDYEVYRNSTVNGFEMTLEQSGKLLRKKLTPYFSSKREVDKLTFKDLFRFSLKYGLITEQEVTRWFKYRDNRNNTAHDYGQKFAEETVVLIQDFINDVKSLKEMIEND